MINWQNLVKIFDKAKQYHGIKKVFLLFFEILFLHLWNEEWTKQTNFALRVPFQKKDSQLQCTDLVVGALQNS